MNLVFVLLLTLSLETGSKDDDDFEAWKRLEVMTTNPQKDFAACEANRPIEIGRLNALWTFVSERTEPKNKIVKIEAVCIGMNAKDAAPKNEGP